MMFLIFLIRQWPINFGHCSNINSAKSGASDRIAFFLLGETGRQE